MFEAQTIITTILPAILIALILFGLWASIAGRRWQEEKWLTALYCEPHESGEVVLDENIEEIEEARVQPTPPKKYLDDLFDFSDCGVVPA